MNNFLHIPIVDLVNELSLLLIRNGFSAQQKNAMISVELIAYTEQFNNMLAIVQQWGANKNLSCAIALSRFDFDESDDAWHYKEGQTYTCKLSFSLSDTWRLSIGG